MVETSHATRYLIFLLVFFFLYSFIISGIMSTYAGTEIENPVLPPLDINDPLTFFPYITGLATGFSTYGVPYPLSYLLIGVWWSIVGGIVFMIAIKSWWIAIIVAVLTAVLALISWVMSWGLF